MGNIRKKLDLPEEPQYDEDGLALNKAAIIADAAIYDEKGKADPEAGELDTLLSDLSD